MHIEQMNGMTPDASHAASPPPSARSSRVAVAQPSSSPSEARLFPGASEWWPLYRGESEGDGGNGGGGGQRNMHCLVGDGDLKSNPSLLLMEGKLLFASPKCMVLLES
jgi:hypothetical protein